MYLFRKNMSKKKGISSISMTKFHSGDQAFHSVHGIGTVEKTGKEYIGVLFDQHGRALLYSP
jgi:hypothetical protein